MWPTLALAMMGFGSGMSLSGNVQAGKSQKRLNEYNAQVASMQGDDALARGEEAAARHREGVRRMIGGQRAAWAASGADVNSGNAVDVVADTAALGELDALTIEFNAAREAWGYRNQAIDYRARGEIAQAHGVYQGVAGAVGTGASMLYHRYGFGRY